MRTGAKSILLLVVAYLGSLVAAAVIGGVTFALLSPRSCSDFSQALLVLWIVVAAVFLVTVAAVGFVAWQLELGTAGRFALVSAFAALLLPTYVVIAFGLMVAFNC
jgi:hypothetical protein